uniref:Protein adenylyltransferase n=1 Tax=Candidatus Kentrum sp. FW TaxID=2126338 RepID=A0A450T9N6_9GAMM|nr:MAG: Fic family protein [Candidatus Kentron sp. FW]
MTKSNSSTRAGRYINQVGGYKAFIPATLPPDPPVKLEGRLQDLLSRADRALGRLDGSIQTLPNSDLFVAMYIRKEAVLSSQIEGTQSSLQDVLAAEARMYSPDRPGDVDEVFNYVRAMNYGLERLHDLPVSVRLIREIHTELLTGVRGQHLTPGELRVSQNWIGSAGCTLIEATFVPPPPHEVPKALGNLEQFLHGDTPLPLLIKIGLAHAQFETIHPFLDGNGRVGRLLITFLLCEKEVLLKPVLYLSHFFKHHRQQYYERLQAVRNRGAWEEWIVFFLESVFEVSQQATDTARQILTLREQHRQVITDRFGRVSGNGHRILEHLYRFPIISVSEIKESTHVSYPTANNLVAKLIECGILHELTNQKRNRRFIYRDYIRLFQDEV